MHDERTDDAQACGVCHKVQGDGRFAHTAPERELAIAKERRLKVSTQTPTPLSFKVRSAINPKLHLQTRNLLCGSCHQEHRGPDFNLKAISSEQCQACHAV